MGLIAEYCGLRKHGRKVARWPHGCRRQCSEVTVPALVGSNPTEGGGFFRRNEPPPGHGCVCMSIRADGRGWWKEERHSSDTTARSAGFESQAGWASHGCCVLLYSCCVVQKKEKREGGRGSPGKVPRSPAAPHKGK
jgi:hypothetical protein